MFRDEGQVFFSNEGTRTSITVIYDLINIRNFVSVCDTAILSFKMFIALRFFFLVKLFKSTSFFYVRNFVLFFFLLLRVKWIRLTLIFCDMMIFIWNIKMDNRYLINRKLHSSMSLLIISICTAQDTRFSIFRKNQFNFVHRKLLFKE